MILAVMMLSVITPNVFAQDSEDGSNEEPTDSIEYDIELLSDEESVSFFDGVIPPTPQAAALARYAEYPVGHTTGLPDISIPLYEINMGGFSLPISISYHNAGARCDEIETCVGLGWSLMAGGAVTRTVLGAPDLEYKDAASADYTYFSLDKINSITQAGQRQSQTLEDLVTRKKDTESDRYTFRAGDYGGPFRYDHATGRYVILNQSGCIITSTGYGTESSFRIMCPDNAVYTYSAQEGTGVDERGENSPAVTAWYVSLIETPWGNVSFTYEPDIIFGIRKDGYNYRSGYLPYVEPADAYTWGMTYFEFKASENEYHTNITYRQILPKTIEWNGNRVEFSYDTSGTGTGKAYGKRLVSMKVVSSSGETVKTVTFGNADLWTASGADRSRRMLRTLSDSQSGIYSFDYHYDVTFPDATDCRIPSSYSDLWGFWCGSVGKPLTPALSEWLSTDKDGTIHRNHMFQSGPRQPSLEHTRAGVLKKITFPTGGNVAYEYELNSGSGTPCGGLRVSRTSVYDGMSFTERRISYVVAIPYPQKREDMMKYMSKMMTSMVQGGRATEPIRSIVDSPVMSSFLSGSSVTYTHVRETELDGNYTDYIYDVFDHYGYATNSLQHPSTYTLAVWDRGDESTRLVEKTVYGCDGTKLQTEKREYASKDLETFCTGVRIVSVFTFCDSYRGQEGLNCESNEAVSEENLQRCETTATRHVYVPSKLTVIDHTTGVSTVTVYDYDPQYRTTQPISVTVTNSDGSVIKTEFEYAFSRSDAVSKDMMTLGQTDTPIVTRKYSGETLLAQSETEFQESNGYYLPFAYKSWSVPTTSNASERVVNLIERERVSEYNRLGRPLAITVNETDHTDLEWGGRGDLLQSSTAPGNLKTSYTHRALFGPSSVMLPNGYRTQFTYNSAGMLEKSYDSSGTIESYTYSIANHGIAAMTGLGNSVTTRRWLNAAGSNSVFSRQYHDGLGRPSVSALGGANTSGKYLYSSVSYDSRGRESVSTLASVGGASMENLSHASVLTLAQSTCSDNYPYSETTYDGLDRPVSVSTSGEAWHLAGKARKTEYVANKSNSVRLYTAPITSVGLVRNGYYVEGTLSGVRTIDEDGNEMTVYSDRLGRKVLERRGPESEKGKNDTYFVSNALGQLRYVISPEYENEASSDKYVYEYRYDSSGQVTWKHIPGAGDAQYWYDRAGRMTFMQDAMLKEKNLYRFFVYDKAGRLAIQGTTLSCNRSETVNFATFTSGGGFSSTCYNLDDPSRILSPTIETVAYYDGYGFTSLTDTRLLPSDVSPASPAGRQTGGVEYCSDGSKSITSILYDLRGNVLQTREITPDSYLRTTTNTYGYTDELLTSTVVENGMTISTKNTYHAASGLPVSTDVTINGTSTTVSKLTYDDLGRMTSTARGGNGGTVRYSYNLHNRTTAISAPGFSQSLYYADGPGVKLYNGSISSMTWMMGTDKTTRGYVYTYNQYGWLTQAIYGETTTLGSNKDRYTEKITSYSLNGMPKALQRNGLRSDGSFGAIDDLKITLDGNRTAKVYEDAAQVTTSGSMDFARATGSNSVFTYNAAGALTRDDSRGITSITYDNLGHPVRINFANGSYTTNVYSASGSRLKTTVSTAVTSLAAELEPEEEAIDPDGIGVITGIQTTHYRGNVVWKGTKVDMVLIPGGYATLADGKESGDPTFHYYSTDYLGNVRAVTNGSTGLTEQMTAYYPFGGVIPTLGANPSIQPYKFGGKELLSANGQNEYDFGARRYAPMIPAFTSVDPLCEKYYWLSPYLYCANNPVNAIDPDGRKTTLYATTLPGASQWFSKATHTFIVVRLPGKEIRYFAFGSEYDGVKGACGGKLMRREYDQDKSVYSGTNKDSDIVKNIIDISAPDGMTQSEFDNKVIEIAESFGNVDGIEYHFATLSETTGNCNSSTYTILKKAGVSEEQLDQIDTDLGMIGDWGFGQLKPWTKKEQKEAVFKKEQEIQERKEHWRTYMNDTWMNSLH